MNLHIRQRIAEAAAGTFRRYLQHETFWSEWALECGIHPGQLALADMADSLHGSPSRSFPRENKFSLRDHPKLEVCQTQGASRLAQNRPKFSPGHRVPHGCGTPSTAMRSIATALKAAPVQWKRWICSRSAPEDEIHLLGCILLMVWAGLHFADVQRTCPSSLLRDRHVLRREHWRTKVSGSCQPFGALAFLVFQYVLHAGVGTMCVSMRFAAGTPVW